MKKNGWTIISMKNDLKRTRVVAAPGRDYWQSIGGTGTTPV